MFIGTKDRTLECLYCDFTTAIFYVILYVLCECLNCFPSSHSHKNMSVWTAYSICVVIFGHIFVIFVCVGKFLHRSFLQLLRFYCVPSRYLLCLCASLCWFYLLCFCVIVCRFSTNDSNFYEHRRCELKCDSICGFAAACGGQEEFFQIILCGSSAACVVLMKVQPSCVRKFDPS